MWSCTRSEVVFLAVVLRPSSLSWRHAGLAGMRCMPSQGSCRLSANVSHKRKPAACPRTSRRQDVKPSRCWIGGGWATRAPSRNNSEENTIFTHAVTLQSSRGALLGLFQHCKPAAQTSRRQAVNTAWPARTGSKNMAGLLGNKECHDNIHVHKRTTFAKNCARVAQQSLRELIAPMVQR